MPLPPSTLSPPTSPFLVPTANGVSMTGMGCSGMSAPSPPPHTPPSQHCRTGTYHSAEHLARPGWCRATSGGGCVAGPSTRIHRWRSKPQEQCDTSRTNQAQAVSAPRAVAPRDLATRQHSDHPLINRQTCAPSCVLAKEGTNSTTELSQAGAGSRLGAGRAAAVHWSRPGLHPQQAWGGGSGHCSRGAAGTHSPPLGRVHTLCPLCHLLRTRASS